MQVRLHYKAISILLIAFFTCSSSSLAQKSDTLSTEEQLDSICQCYLIKYSASITPDNVEGCNSILEEYLGNTGVSVKELNRSILPCFYNGLNDIYRKDFYTIYQYDSVDFSYQKRKRITQAYNHFEELGLISVLNEVILHAYNKRVDNRHLWSLLLDEDELMDSTHQKPKTIFQKFELIYNEENLVFKNHIDNEGKKSVSKLKINGKLVDPGYLNAPAVDLLLSNYGLNEGDSFILEISYNALYPPTFFNIDKQLKNE